ncbi:MAG: hypothetical protein KME30_14400 [Iphinoe sp. HA4291-MV1]|nr:hypothetical protein [Iphinoe sp. HA4291-MV1]
MDTPYLCKAKVNYPLNLSINREEVRQITFPRQVELADDVFTKEVHFLYLLE